MKIKFWTKKCNNHFCSHFLKEKWLMELLGVKDNRKIEDQILDAELSCMIDDLGNYEDLMHQYSISTWEQLEKILKEHQEGKPRVGGYQPDHSTDLQPPNCGTSVIRPKFRR